MISNELVNKIFKQNQLCDHHPKEMNNAKNILNQMNHAVKIVLSVYSVSWQI